jgi:hypothetical protein
MKSTEIFKRTIRNYLEQRAVNDELFAVAYRKPHKNIDDCITYILNTVRKSGCNGFADDEIYSLATHFWDEDDIDVGKPFDCQVIVNHTVELTIEEKEEARKEAIQRLQDEAYRQMKQPGKKSVAKQTVANEQLNLFFDV